MEAGRRTAASRARSRKKNRKGGKVGKQNGHGTFPAGVGVEEGKKHAPAMIFVKGGTQAREATKALASRWEKSPRVALWSRMVPTETIVPMPMDALA